MIVRRIAWAVVGCVALVLVGKAAEVPMTEAKPGAVKPCGWLRDRACAARNGFTGHMDDVDGHFRRAWTADWKPRGNYLNWGWKDQRDKCSWSSEGGAYWFDGLVRLAFQLDDAELQAFAKKRLDPLLDRVDGNSIGFLWWMDRRDPKQVEEALGPGRWQFWVIGMSERVLAAWYEATGDARVPRALTHAFGFEAIAQRHGAEAPLASGMIDAERLTGSPEVAKCCDVACAKLAAKSQYATPPWEFLADTLNLKRKHHFRFGIPSRHGVFASEQLLSVFRAAQRADNAKLRAAVVAWYDFFDRHCAQPYGVTMMDEEWGWAGAARGTETCDVAAEMYTRINLLAGLADGRWGDDVERAFFNAGPACVSRDFKTGVYFQLPNRVGDKSEGALFSCLGHEHTRYALGHWPLCCTAALNRILPNFVQAMWMRTAEGGVAATLYGPSTFATEIPAGRVAFTETTDYPFAETISIAVDEAPSKAFPLKVRLPGWCTAPEVRVNGARVEAKAVRGFAAIDRVWKKGDVVELCLPMKPVVKTMRDMNEFGRTRAFVSMGPLLFAYGVPEKDENTPAVPVVVPVVDPKTVAQAARVTRGPVPHPWDWRLDAPVKLQTCDAKGVPLTLVPYGCAKLHISMFPVD